MCIYIYPLVHKHSVPCFSYPRNTNVIHVQLVWLQIVSDCTVVCAGKRNLLVVEVCFFFLSGYQNVSGCRQVSGYRADCVPSLSRCCLKCSCSVQGLGLPTFVRLQTCVRLTRRLCLLSPLAACLKCSCTVTNMSPVSDVGPVTGKIVCFPSLALFVRVRL